jgi:hypothetical protein
MPTYTIIPNATDQPSQSQSQIRTNFQSIQSLVDVNHVDFADGVNFGKHNFVSLVQQTSDPTTSATEIALYSKLLSGVLTLFLRPASNGTPITPMNPGVVTIGSPTISPSGGSYNVFTTVFPGGLVLKWGTIHGSTPLTFSTWNTVNFGTPFPTSAISVLVSTYSDATPPAVPPQISLTAGALTLSNFQVYPTLLSGPSSPRNITFLALGQ